MAKETPRRVMDPFAKEFWEYAAKKELRMQKCSSCSKLRWPASAICDACLAPEYEWTQISGKGKVLSWIVFHRQYFPEWPAPHPAVAVELDEGPIFVCTMPEGFAGTDLSDALPMEVTWLEAVDVHGEYNLPLFKPAGK
jgi:uncharacterized OB-fold protein